MPLYTNIIKVKTLFLWLNALISGITSPISKIISMLDSPVIEGGYTLYMIMLRPKRTEYQ